MTELKNCPFCGEKATVEYLQDTKLHQVSCTSCTCHTPWDQQAISLWNKRTTNETTLKPCPLCTHKAKILEDNDGVFYVQCQECGIYMGDFQNRDEAIANWNRRNYE